GQVLRGEVEEPREQGAGEALGLLRLRQRMQQPFDLPGLVRLPQPALLVERERNVLVGEPSHQVARLRSLGDEDTDIGEFEQPRFAFDANGWRRVSQALDLVGAEVGEVTARFAKTQVVADIDDIQRRAPGAVGLDDAPILLVGWRPYRRVWRPGA